MRFVETKGAGGIEVLTLSNMPSPAPKNHEVLIDVHAAGINRPDLSQRKGAYPPPPDASPILGLEVAGTVAAKGKDVTSLEVGDAVCALVHGGGYAEQCIAPATQCLPLPKGWSMIEAAGIPETFFTVWANVFQLGRLRSGDRILIHGGAGGIGTTAIQLARAFGAQVFTTAGTDEKCDACLKIGASHAINYRKSSFAEEVMRLTDNQGVNVILDMVGGDYTEKNIECLSAEGRLVQIAIQKGGTVSINLWKIMQKRLIITGSTLRPRSIEDKARIARELHEEVWPLLEKRKVQVVIDKTFSLTDVRKAHEYLESGDHFGKVILEVRPSNGLSASARPRT